MKKEQVRVIPLEHLKLNKGQLDWLPKNPRQWSKDDVKRLARSMDEDADMMQDRPLLAVPGGKDFVVFAGNLRLTAARDLKWPGAPVVVYTPEDQIDRETIKRRAMKDNGSFGQWDYDELANNFDDLPLADWGVPAWPSPNKGAGADMGLSTAGKEGVEGYDEFTDKFKPKLTTDDCYTPPAVWEVVRDFVDEKVASLKGRTIVRPFKPGGDYENLAQYPKDCVVLDNPPFSILSSILRFYAEHGIDFFLFGPHLTLFTAPDTKGLTYLPICAPVTYENGAVVSTGLITNMRPGIKIWIPAGLRHRIVEVQRDMTPIDEYLIPPCVITSSRLGAVAGVKGVNIEIRDEECEYIRNLDAMKEKGKGLYGGGLFYLGEEGRVHREGEGEGEGEGEETPYLPTLRKGEGHRGEAGIKRETQRTWTNRTI